MAFLTSDMPGSFIFSLFLMLFKEFMRVDLEVRQLSQILFLAVMLKIY